MEEKPEEMVNAVSKVSFDGQKRNSRRFPERDALIAEGLSCRRIALARGMTQAGAHKYIIKTGQQDFWKKRRQEVYDSIKNSLSERIDSLEVILSLIDSKATERAIQEGWPTQKALEYVNSRKHGSYYSFEDLVSLFSKYETAKNSGRKLSLDRLREGTGIRVNVDVAQILKSVGLEPMFGSLDRHPVSKEKKDAMKKSVQLKMHHADVSYFLGVPSYIVKNNLRLWGLNDGKKLENPCDIFTVPKQFKRDLTYRLASEALEARDIGLDKSQSCQLLDTSTELLDIVLENGDLLTNKIVNALRTLYPRREINKPYVDFRNY